MTDSPKNNLNQIGDSTNKNICFEHNGRGSDTNHHWAVWGDCSGQYVNGGGSQLARGAGWNRIAYIPGPKKFTKEELPLLGSCQEIFEHLTKMGKKPITGLCYYLPCF